MGNYADRGYTRIQVGRITPPSERPARPECDGSTDVEVTNTQADNATVGRQTDEVTGSITISKTRRR